MTRTQELKKPIRAFMQAHYTDERLTWLLEHARRGKLSYQSCCCFIGIPTSDHPLHGHRQFSPEHYFAALDLSGAEEAEEAFFEITEHNRVRRRILIPMVKAEMRRRERVRVAEREAQEALACK